MARRKGIISRTRGIFRWAIWGLAALFAVALYINFTTEPVTDTGEGELVLNVPPADSPEVVETPVETSSEGEAQLEDTMEGGDTEEVVSDAVEEELEEATSAETDAGNDGVAEDSASVEEQAEALEAEGNEAPSEQAPAMEETEAEAEAPAETEDAAEAPADSAEAMADDESVPSLDTTDAAEGAIPEVATDLTPSLGTVTIPGDDATYEFISAFRRDDGLIEMVTRKDFEGLAIDVTRLVRCAPLEVGLIAEGDGARIDAPAMEPIVLGNAVATLAAMACGAMK